MLSRRGFLRSVLDAAAGAVIGGYSFLKPAPLLPKDKLPVWEVNVDEAWMEEHEAWMKKHIDDHQRYIASRTPEVVARERAEMAKHFELSALVHGTLRSI